MARRPLVATVVTTIVGALLGAILGAVVGRVIAMFDDPTVETSLPVVFCGTLGFFVGGASAAKGSLDRFGARRVGAGTTVALAVMVLIVGYAFFARVSGPIIFAAGLVAAVLAGAAASALGAPQQNPVTRSAPRRPAGSPKQAKAAPAETIEAEFLESPEPTLSPEPAPPVRPAIRKVPVAPERSVAPPAAERAPASAEQVNWTLDEATSDAPEPATRPVAKKKTTSAPSTRPRRDRPLRKGDA